MRMSIRSKGFDLLEGTKKGIEKQLNKVDVLFPKDTVFDVYLNRRDVDYKCEIKVQRGKDFVRSEEVGKTIEHAIDNAVGTLQKRARKLKSLKLTKKRVVPNIVGVDVTESVNESEVQIGRYKVIKADLVSEEDAIVQLESLNHDFYVFRNADKKGIMSVVYRRNKDYGVLNIE